MRISVLAMMTGFTILQTSLSIGCVVGTDTETDTLEQRSADSQGQNGQDSSPSRTETIHIAEAYIERGLVDGDWANVPLATNCTRTEDGWSTGVNAAEIRQASMAITGIEGVRLTKWVVQGNDAVAFMELAGGGFLYPIGEYFKVSNGRLKDIRPNFPSLDPPPNSFGPAVRPPKVSEPSGDPTLDLVNGYLKGIAHGSLAGVHLGSHVIYTENFEVVGGELAGVSQYLQDNWLGQVVALTPQKWISDGEEAAVLYVADMTEGRPRWVTQYFRVYDGTIREMRAMYGSGPTLEETQNPHAP
jgi:hypothetical protein